MPNAVPALTLDPLDGGFSVVCLVKVGRRSSAVLQHQAVAVLGPEDPVVSPELLSLWSTDQHPGNGARRVGPEMEVASATLSSTATPNEWTDTSWGPGGPMPQQPGRLAFLDRHHG